MLTCTENQKSKPVQDYLLVCNSSLWWNRERVRVCLSAKVYEHRLLGFNVFIPKCFTCIRRNSKQIRQRQINQHTTYTLEAWLSMQT